MITEMIEALSAGKQLSNSAGWKNAQLTTNAVAAVLAGTLGILSLVGFHPPISHEQILAIAGGVAAVLGVCNSYITVATTKTIGLPPSGGTGVSAGDYRAGNDGAP